MTFLDRLERRFGHLAIVNITMWLVLIQSAIYFSTMIPDAPVEGLLEKIELVPGLVQQGEVWRLLTYTITPPRFTLLGYLIYAYVFYSLGSALEASWGSFRYNIYLFVGYSLTAVAAFFDPWFAADNHYVTTSVFLAYAALYPYSTILMELIIPIQARFAAAVTWALLGYWFYIGSFAERMMIIASVGNFLLFFWQTFLKNVKHKHRRQQFKNLVNSPKTRVVHECCVCRLTSEMSPRTTFRYCSKCEGQCSYCPDHIHDHECVKANDS